MSDSGEWGFGLFCGVVAVLALFWVSSCSERMERGRIAELCMKTKHFTYQPSMMDVRDVQTYVCAPREQ